MKKFNSNTTGLFIIFLIIFSYSPVLFSINNKNLNVYTAYASESLTSKPLLLNGLVAYYPFDNDVKDYINYGQNGLIM